MVVKRIVPNIGTSEVGAARQFYADIRRMKVVLDLGWIATFATDSDTTPQVSFATEGGSGTAVPDFSVEVDNLDEVLQRVHRDGIPVEYWPASEPWGVSRFFVRDPFGRLLNILSHT